MQRLLRLLPVLITCFGFYFAAAQNRECTAVFTYSLTGNKTVNFISTDTLEVANRWLFGDGTAAVVTDKRSIAHQYAAAGEYEVKHFIERKNPLCNDSVVKKIIIPAPDNCDFSIKYSYQKDSNDCKKVKFINLSNSLPATGHFIWKFGDGTSSNDFAPSHIYTQPGKYYVCLVVEVGPNCRKEYCDSIKVTCETACNNSARFEWKRDSANCKTVRFFNLSSPISSDVHFIWKFGDGSTSHDITPSHTYAQTGKYYVCLVTESTTGCRKEYCDSIKVNCETSCNVDARFSQGTLTGSPLTIRFEPSYKSSTAKYSWNFGDGTNAESRDPLHLYHQPGKYNVCLSIKEKDCITTKCETINVGIICDSVKLRYEYSSMPNHPNEVKFKAICNEPLLSQTWRITRISNNASTSPVATLQVNNPEYLFPDTGWYKVCLNATTASLCNKEYCEKIHITSVTNSRSGPTISPNPAINNISFEINLEKSEQLTIRILDANGYTKAEYHKPGVAGINRFTLPVENLAPGIYVLQITTGTKIWISRFQKG